MNGYAPNSHPSDEFEAKLKGQGHQGQETAFFGPFGGLRAVYVW